MVAFWGHVALSYPSASPEVCITGQLFSILGTNQPFLFEGRPAET